MIVKMAGTVAEIQPQAVTIERDGLTYEVLVPRYALGELAAHRGQQVILHTLEYFEGNAAGGHLIPRLVGFLHREDRAFFGRFIEVKGIGMRKALKALAEPISRIAGWIQEGDTSALARLPGIGKRAAEMIVAELKGKIDEFVGGEAEPAATASWARHQRDALEIMVAWGDARGEAERWLERASQLHPDIAAAEEWVKACYKIKSGAEG